MNTTRTGSGPVWGAGPGLIAEIAARFTGGLNISPDEVHSLPPEAQQDFLHAFVAALSPVFLVGAVLTARTFSMRGVAISLGQSDPWQWETAAHYAPAVARWMCHRKEGPDVLNVNVPGRPLEDIRGVHWADLDEFGYFRVATADPEAGRLQFVVGPSIERSDPASDTVLCDDGYVTLTPLRTVEPAPFPPVDAREVVEHTVGVAS